MSSIPDHVDVIILGTSLTNSIVAAACSRIGKSVLHLDKNGYYGGDWASFTYQQLLDWIRVNQPEDPCLSAINEELVNKSRMFCIDLAPRFLYSNGPMVELLVKSNVARYHEFKNNIRILSMIGDSIHVMPCRRNEVFTSPLLSNLADKRRLMKFIELCIKYDPNENASGGDDDDVSQRQSSCEVRLNSGKPIVKFLEERSLNETLREFIINSIAMVQPTDPTGLACQKIKNFMIATERYGRSPFLFPLYGCGEFPQSFCRLSAVFGGIYCLHRQIQKLDFTKSTVDGSDCASAGKFRVQFSNDEDIVVSSDNLVMDYDYIDDKNQNIEKINLSYDKLSRAILITNKSIVSNDEIEDNQPVSFLKIPSSSKNEHPIFVLEFNSSALVCPKGLNIVYLWTNAISPGGPELDLATTIGRIFKEKTETILWRYHYHQLTRQNIATHHDCDTTNLYITMPPCDNIDYESNIKDAERIFNQMCPNQEFLPRAPDPDEIIST